MFLVRIIGAAKPQVYALVGSHEPCAWQFWNYERGAAAKAETELQALRAAQRVMAKLDLDSRGK